MRPTTETPRADTHARTRKEPSSLAEKAYARLEEMIVTLELQPGHTLSEGELSRRTGIGRTPLREALQRLVSQGLVVTLPRRGLLVSDINIPEHFALLDTRRILDRQVATRAARRATPGQRQQLEACASAMTRVASLGDLPEFMRLDREFDDTLEAAARNPWAARALAPMHSHCRRFWYLYRHNGDLTHAASLHAALMNAVAAEDERAAATASDALLDYLEQFTRAALEIF